MREIRTSGSEGGETGQPVFPTPIFARRERLLGGGTRRKSAGVESRDNFMKALDIGTIARKRAPRQGKAFSARALSLCAGLAAAATLACAVSCCGVAQAASGALHRGTGAGLKMDVDTRWPSGAGYRPVRITVTPVAPAIADRTLTV